MSYMYDGDENGEYGIYVAEGTGDDGRCFLRRKLSRSADTAIAVMCRECGGKKGKATSRILAKFEYWFRHEFPLNRQPFSPEVVKCYWSRIIGGWREVEQNYRGLAVLFIYRGRLVFCGMGEFAVYEYVPGEGQNRRWPIGRERHDLDRELGIPEPQTANITFFSRSISKETLFLILPRQLCLKYPNCGMKNQTLRQFAGELARYAPCAALCLVQYR